MSRLIIADLKRIIRKKGFIAMLVFVFLVQIMDIFSFNLPDDELMSEILDGMKGFNLLLVAVTIYLPVYGDDLKSNAVPTVIGTGFSRNELLFSKFLDCAILSVIMYALIMAGKLLWLNTDEVRHLSNRQQWLLVLYSVFCVIRCLFCITMSVMLQTLSGISAIGVIGIFVFIMVIPSLLQFAQLFWSIEVYDYSLSGIIADSFAAFSAGGFGIGIIPGTIIYLGIAFLALALVFGKKELDL